MFTAIYTNSKTLLYTNLILTGRNNIFVDLLPFTPSHRCTANETTRSPSRRAARPEPSPRSVWRDHGGQCTTCQPPASFCKGYSYLCGILFYTLHANLDLSSIVRYFISFLLNICYTYLSFHPGRSSSQ